MTFIFAFARCERTLIYRVSKRSQAHLQITFSAAAEASARVWKNWKLLWCKNYCLSLILDLDLRSFVRQWMFYYISLHSLIYKWLSVLCVFTQNSMIEMYLFVGSYLINNNLTTVSQQWCVDALHSCGSDRCLYHKEHNKYISKTHRQQAFY